jgi:hypothetical protein
MAIDWMNGFIIPLIKLVFIIGIFSFIFYYVGKAFYNAYTKSFKFFVKYSILKKDYPDEIVKYLIECIDNNMTYHNVKRELYIKGWKYDDINEILYIYDQLIKQMLKENKLKGGGK